MDEGKGLGSAATGGGKDSHATTGTDARKDAGTDARNHPGKPTGKKIGNDSGKKSATIPATTCHTPRHAAPSFKGRG